MTGDLVATGPPAGLAAGCAGAHPWGRTKPANSAASPTEEENDAEACERPVVAPRGVPRSVNSQASTSVRDAKSNTQGSAAISAGRDSTESLSARKRLAQARQDGANKPVRGRYKGGKRVTKGT